MPFDRRILLRLGILGALGALGGGAALYELVDHEVLPGHQELISLLGDCDVSVPPAAFSAPGPQVSGTFFSNARRKVVGYTIAYPPGHAPGIRLPLVVALHAFGASHKNALAGLSLAAALALDVDGAPLAPMAMVAADGGGGYWHPHPGDNPLGMVIDELVPMCRRRGLGAAPQRIGAIGVSMGGYGVLNLAEHAPSLVAAAAAVSPAVWTTYEEARGANPGAFSSASEFADNDVVTHASELAGIALRIDSGLDDPFHPGVVALEKALPPGAVIDIRKGCHDGNFMRSAEPSALAFLAEHLVR